MKTITIQNDKLSLELTQEQWDQAVASAKTALRGNQTPEQWARCIILTREARRLQRKNDHEAEMAQYGFVAKHITHPEWMEPVAVCLKEFLPTGWYRLTADGLLAQGVRPDSDFLMNWADVAYAGILFMATNMALADTSSTDQQSMAMRHLEKDADRNALPIGQFCHLQDITKPYFSDFQESAAKYRSQLSTKYNIPLPSED